MQAELELTTKMVVYLDHYFYFGLEGKRLESDLKEDVNTYLAKNVRPIPVLLAENYRHCLVAQQTGTSAVCGSRLAKNV